MKGYWANKVTQSDQRKVILNANVLTTRTYYSVVTVTVDLFRRSWVRFPPRSKDFFFASRGSLIPFTRANAQWVFHGLN